MVTVVARSLKDAAKFGSATTSLLLRSSEDLVCRNLMCAKLGGACVCKLAVHLSRLGGLRELDIAENGLGMLPESVFQLPELEHLDISGNGLTALPPTVAALANLRTLRLSNNILTELPRELGSLPRLQEVHVDGNIRLDPQNLDELLQRRPELRIVGSD
ncbi:unnamed protein product [Ascophyllum nodosum]